MIGAQMRSPAVGSGRASSQQVIKSNFDNKAVLDKAQVDLTLGAIRSAVNRIDEIRQELVNAGLSLKAGYVTPQQALDWAEEFAPGCVGFVPPLSGLRINRTSGGE
ncbi:hypothetical protein ACE102_21800 [Bradyrhizobium sp. vgs-9]|uniref:hypothetical protein n=1 Tax=Bradyrhizobium sp. vgs-9 TaxID=208389 RepID=UPI0035D4CBFD